MLLAFIVLQRRNSLGLLSGLVHLYLLIEPKNTYTMLVRLCCFRQSISDSVVRKHRFFNKCVSWEKYKLLWKVWKIKTRRVLTLCMLFASSRSWSVSCGMFTGNWSNPEDSQCVAPLRQMQLFGQPSTSSVNKANSTIRSMFLFRVRSIVFHSQLSFSAIFCLHQITSAALQEELDCQ